MPVRETNAYRHAHGFRGRNRISDRQAIKQFQFARRPGGAEPGEGLAREYRVVRCHGGMPHSPSEPVNNP